MGNYLGEVRLCMNELNKLLHCHPTRLSKSDILIFVFVCRNVGSGTCCMDLAWT